METKLLDEIMGRKTFESLEEFATKGDDLITENPEVIRFLERNGFIAYLPTEVNSLSSLCAGKPSKSRVEHFIWTMQGSKSYGVLKELYR